MFRTRYTSGPPGQADPRLEQRKLKPTPGDHIEVQGNSQNPWVVVTVGSKFIKAYPHGSDRAGVEMFRLGEVIKVPKKRNRSEVVEELVNG